MGITEKVAGAFLIILGIIIFINALPTMNAATYTTTGSIGENYSAQVKSIMPTYQYFLMVIPIFMFAVGVGLLWKG